MTKKSSKKRKFTRKLRVKATDEKSNKEASVANSSSKIDVEYLDIPVQSDCDKNEYRAIKLSNGLHIVLVKNPTISAQEKEQYPKFGGTYGRDRSNPMEMMRGQASCRLALNVGSFSDPPEVPCVAEILSNVVLKASQKYPQPNSFLNFLVRSGGNLATSARNCERTSFNFCVSEKHFHEAIERFVECFAQPLLKKDDVEKERINIETREEVAEEVLHLARIELHGKQHIFDSIASKIAGHPGSNFGPDYIDNLFDQTNEKIFEEVQKFMKRHYSAHRMAVVLEGRLPLDTLESYAINYFSKIPNNDLPPSDYTRFSFEQCFDKPEFRMMYHMSSFFNNLEDCQLELNWPMPSGQKLYRSKPQDYLAWIMNHEGEGSLKSYLTSKSWCTNLHCGINKSQLEGNSVYSLFNVTLYLTKKGYENRKQVLDAVFSYINLMRHEGPQKRIYEEIRKIEEVKFRSDPETVVTRSLMPLHDCMLVSSTSDYLTAGILYLEYSPTLINQCLDLLLPEKANIIVFDYDIAKRDSASAEWEVEGECPTHYSKTVIPKDWIDNWKTVKPLPEFNLPKVNPFIGDDDPLVSASENSPDYPTMIYSDEIARIWYKLDVKFLKRECFVDYFFCSPLPVDCAENRFMMDLFKILLDTLAINELYAAEVARLHCSIQSHETGLVVIISGHNKKILMVSKEIVRIAKNLEVLVTEDAFKSAREKLLDMYRMAIFMPQKLTREVKLSIARSVYWSSCDKYKASSKVDFAMFKDFARCFTKRLRIDCLAQGNLKANDVIENVRECAEIFGCEAVLPNSIPRLGIHEIPRGTHCCRFKLIAPIFEDTTVMNYYQFGDRSLRQSVMIKLFCSFILDPQFARLRTREKLDNQDVLLTTDFYDKYGYSLFVEQFEAHGLAKIAAIDGAIEKFRKSANRLFKDLSKREWREIKESFVDSLEKPDYSLECEFRRNWGEIASESLVFDKRERELEIFKKFSIEDLREGMMNITAVGSGLRKLSVQAVGNMKPTRRPNIRTLRIDAELELLTNMPREKEHLADYFITDIKAYKRELPILPLLELSSISDISEAIRRDCNV